MEDKQITALLEPVMSALDEDYRWMLANRPLLAHYTSIEVIERILQDGELWFSNPLFMNDLEEMRFGMLEGKRLFENSQAIRDLCGAAQRHEIIINSFNDYFDQFTKDHALDVYVFCLSEHHPSATDGLLSMWRAYGAQGNGAALIFNTKFLTAHTATPLVLAKVLYDSREDRLSRLAAKIKDCCDRLSIIRVPDNKLWVVAHQIFTVIKLYSLISKHNGFHEEREWRIIYLPDRDPQGLLIDRFGYAIGKRGVEPKLKFRIEPLTTESKDNWTFETILDQIILGPSLSSQLAQSTIERMLKTIKRPEFCGRVVASTIPLRPS